MRKLVALILLVSGALLISCDGGSDPTAQLNYTNNQGTTISEIKWTSSGVTNQTWAGDYAQGQSTATQEVTALTGQSEAVDAGLQEWQLEYLDGTGTPQQSLSLTDGSTNNWTISGLAKKK